VTGASDRTQQARSAAVPAKRSSLKRCAAPNDPMEPSRSRGFQTHKATDVRSRDNGSIVRRRFPRWIRPLGAPRLRAPGGEPHLCLQWSAIGRRHTSAWTKRSGGMCQRIAVRDERLPGMVRIEILLPKSSGQRHEHIPASGGRPSVIRQIGSAPMESTVQHGLPHDAIRSARLADKAARLAG
jgi:hypothetical protein